MAIERKYNRTLRMVKLLLGNTKDDMRDLKELKTPADRADALKLVLTDLSNELAKQADGLPAKPKEKEKK